MTVRVALIAAATVAAACGGSPSAPAPGAVALAAGNYTLNVFAGSGGLCFTSSSDRSVVPESRLAVPVVVSAHTNAWTITLAQGDTLTMSLERAEPGVVRGRLRGTARDAVKSVTFDHVLWGSPLGASPGSGIAGVLTGSPVVFESAAASTSCSDAGWSLLPR